MVFSSSSINFYSVFKDRKENYPYLCNYKKDKFSAISHTHLSLYRGCESCVLQVEQHKKKGFYDMKTAELLFPKVESTKASLLLLASRLVFGLTFASHGLDKLQHFADTAAHFPAPFGLSGEVAVGLSIFGELVCGLAFVFGFLTRLTLLPMIFTMIVAFTTVHGGSVSGGELAFLYLVIFVLSWFAGAGRFSVDGIIRSKFSH